MYGLYINLYVLCLFILHNICMRKMENGKLKMENVCSEYYFKMKSFSYLHYSYPPCNLCASET